jgi:hypothetical protein
MSTTTLTRPLSRTSAGRVIGGCNTCGTGISLAGKSLDSEVTVTCPGCGHPVRLAMVNGRMSDEECNTLCMYAVGPDCECGCGGANHGNGYSVRLVPTWIPTDATPYPTVTATVDVPAEIVARNAARRERVAARAAEKAAALLATADAYRAELFAAHPELKTLMGERFADSDSEFVQDMRANIRNGADMTPRMIAACVRVVESTLTRDARDAARAARQAAAVASGVTVPTGRVTFTGTIESTRVETNDRFSRYGTTDVKARITAADGWSVWGNIPRTAYPAQYSADSFAEWRTGLVGQSFTVTAALEPSKKDPTFGFFSRARLTPYTPTVPATPAPAQPATEPATPTVAAYVSGW